jgi:hypothetical protein
LLRRPDVAARVRAARVRVVREREAARVRQQRKRDRKRPLLAQAEREAAERAKLIASMEEDRYSLARGPRAGTSLPYIDSEGRYWAHSLVLYTGLRRATRRDYIDNGWTVPLNFEDADPMLAFGPPNAPPRYPIGYVPPEDRKTIRVRRMEPGPYGEVEHRKSVSPSELDAATAEGWQVVDAAA